MQESSSPVRTILTLVVICLFLHIWLMSDGLLYAAALLGMVGVFSPWLSEKVDFLWMKLAWILSLIIPNIVLSIIFYVILFPMSILARIFRKDDPLILRDTGKSTFHKMEDGFTKDFFEKPW